MKIEEERAVKMKEFYERAAELDKAMYYSQADGRLISGDKSKVVGQAIWNFVVYYHDNKIHFSIASCDYANKIYRYFTRNHGEITMYPSFDEFYEHKIGSKGVDEWDIKWQKISGPLHNLMTQLEDEFKKILPIKSIV
jgi:hypothetical protein